MFGSASEAELDRVLLELRSAAVKATELRTRSCQGTSAGRRRTLSSQHQERERKKDHPEILLIYTHTHTRAHTFTPAPIID